MTKRKNNSFIIVILIVIFCLFLYIIYRPYDYTKIYNLNEYNIEEIYNKNNSYYVFNITKENIKYSFLIKGKYTKNRKLIDKIESFDNCILPQSDYLSFYPLCYKDDIIYSYNNQKNNDLFDYQNIDILNDNYNNISINYLNGKKYLIYNYRGFYLLSDKKEIKLYDKDVYNIDLVYYLNNYVLIPDYNSNYYFEKFYLINMNNGKVDEIKLDKKISFTSIFLGDYENNIYLLDKKEEKEYKIDIRKKKVEETNFYILENNKLVKKNYLTIVNNHLTFNKDNLYKYEIINKNLYQVIGDNKIKLSNLEVSKIVKNSNDTVYYLVKDKLYMFNHKYGEILLLSNFEWNFNNTNMIFISE